jgi:hypothetical protein
VVDDDDDNSNLIYNNNEMMIEDMVSNVTVVRMGCGLRLKSIVGIHTLKVTM